MSLKISNILVCIVLVNSAAAQYSPGDCTMALVSLSPCVAYISGNSSAPSAPCCSRLSGVVRSQPQCLCGLLKGGTSNFGILVNRTTALALPSACRVETPPVCQCDAVNGPAMSAPVPSGSPVDGPPEDPNPSSNTDPNPSSDTDTYTTPPDAGRESKTVGGTDGSSVGGSSNTVNGGIFSLMGCLIFLLLLW
ncbi:Bifunctional inhibitor/lipid-transfer protein/seed storage 2S albumin superfamily protein [Striga hermonthica]|uniref:Bifunctional inhibitor/lipid-transfer protein/seed storage 2S albumin superfamily protein n=1 Tax=Striga hermonthica TaxID=68872 RepID=A0A9N7NEC3_STRHE|nr:Bifunctional inhibitor/lipid-transfer protein/seed storage 2S albumin superfamily protein [Striga hermonthica]